MIPWGEMLAAATIAFWAVVLWHAGLAGFGWAFLIGAVAFVGVGAFAWLMQKIERRRV